MLVFLMGKNLILLPKLKIIRIFNNYVTIVMRILLWGVMIMPSVESFDLDHNAVKAPYVRHCGVHKVGSDGVVNKYDIRFCQPNKQAMKPDTIHTLEHLLAFNLREHAEKYDHFDIIDISPMGCQTGYYL